MAASEKQLIEDDHKLLASVHSTTLPYFDDSSGMPTYYTQAFLEQYVDAEIKRRGYVRASDLKKDPRKAAQEGTCVIVTKAYVDAQQQLHAGDGQALANREAKRLK